MSTNPAPKGPYESGRVFSPSECELPCQDAMRHVEGCPTLPGWMSSGDHPHSDPGDGRTECLTCGKWIFEITHSCKGVPVTEAAKARASYSTQYAYCFKDSGQGPFASPHHNLRGLLAQGIDYIERDD